MENLPPGFRFFPTEEELVGFYLHHKLQGQIKSIDKVIPVIDINGVDPWNLPIAGELCRGETEQWFFFSPGQEREARGGRPNRITCSGYWKATGSPGYVYSSDNKVIGVKKSMVFYIGKAPTGRKTKWKLNEYKAIQVSDQSTSTTATPQLRREFSLCRVYVVSGSSRAFDRRPSENPTESRQHGIVENRVDAPFTLQASSMDGSCSSFLQQEVEGTSSTNWNVNDDGGGDKNSIHGVPVQLQEQLWEWEQLI